jgi:hypothetical protein
MTWEWTELKDLQPKVRYPWWMWVGAIAWIVLTFVAVV